MSYLTRDVVAPEMVTEQVYGEINGERPYKNITVKSGGVVIELSIDQLCNRWGVAKGLSDEDKNTLRKNNINPKYAKAYIKQQTEYQAIRLTEVNKLRDDLLVACEDYKSDINYIGELEGLYVFEAEEMLVKLERRIEKKSSPKALKQYKKLMEVRKETPITCN